MIEVEFLKDWKCNYSKGDKKKVLAHFAHALIEANIARAVEVKSVRKPPRDKMISEAVMEK